MIKYKSNCSVCQLIKKDKRGRQIANRIYECRYYNPTGKESVKALSESLKVNRSSLSNHIKKHQFISQSDLDQHRMKTMLKKSEAQVVEKIVKHTDVRQEIMQQGMDDLKEGKIKLNANNMLTAARDQSNFEQKQADQQMKIAEMIWFYASGEAKTPGLEGAINGIPENNGSPQELIGDNPEGTGRPSTVYPGIIGDEPPRGTDTLSQGSHPQTNLD